MISQTFSNKQKPNRSPFLFSYVQSFQFRIVALNLAVLCIMAFMLVMVLQNESLVRLKLANPDLLYNLIGGNTAPMITLLLITQSVVTAVLSFSFMFNKRASALYLSLPIRRGQLFFSKYLAGLTMIFLPIVAFLTVMLIINIQVFGYSVALMTGFFLLLCAVVVTMLCIYSISVVISLYLGTSAEGFAFSVLFLLAPLMLSIATTSFFSLFLYGSEFGASTIHNTSISPGLTNYFVRYIPVYSLTQYLNYFGFAFTSNHDASSALYKEAAMVLSIWFALQVVFIFVAHRSFKRYQAENAGVLAINKTIGFLGSFLIVYFTLSIFFDASGNSTNASRILWGLSFSALLYLVSRFLFTLNHKIVFSVSSFYQFGAILAVISVMCLLPICGLFGYRTYQPELDTIRSARITYTGAPDFIIGDSHETGNYLYRGVDEDIYVSNSVDKDIYVREFTDMEYTAKSDIETVLAIHRQMIEQKPAFFGDNRQRVDNGENDSIKVQMHVQYTLENGDVINRFYRAVTPESAMGLLQLETTELLSEKVEESFQFLKNMGNIGTVLITGGLFQGGQFLELDAQEQDGLLTALFEDSVNMDISSKYFPGTLATFIVTMPRVTLDGEAELDRTEREPGYYEATTSFLRFFITDQYPKTMQFIQNLGLAIETSTLDNMVEELYVERYRVNPNFGSRPLFFRAYATDSYEKHSGLMPIDMARLEEVLSLSKNCYYTAEGGYVVKVKIRDINGTYRWISLFLPENAAPDDFKGL